MSKGPTKRACLRAGAGGLLCAVLTFCLTACDTFKTTLYPDPPPTPAMVQDEYAKFQLAWTAIGNEPAAYVSSGYTLADAKCTEFFTNLRKLRNDTTMAKDVARNLVAAAGVITSLTTAPTAVLTGLFGATGVVPGVIDDFQKTFLFADAGDSLFPLISSAMATYRGTFPAGEATRLNASQRVRQHATLCSVPYLTYIVKTGVTEIDKPAPSAAGIPATTSAPAPAAAAPAFGFQPPQAAPRGPIDAGGARYSTQQRISGQPVGAK